MTKKSSQRTAAAGVVTVKEFGSFFLNELERAYPLHLPDVLRTHHRVPEPGR